MALTRATASDIDAAIEQLLAQRNDRNAQERLLQDTHRSVQRFEAKFGIPSEQIHQAIDDGTLEETLEVCHWIFQYNLLCRAKAR
jgi:hypothetical protein